MADPAVLTLLCGLSFSGKSTLADRLAAELPAELVALDAINAERDLDGGQGIGLSEWSETNRIAHERASAFLRDGRDVVVDDTGSPRFIRDDWRWVVAEAESRFVLVWVTIDPGLQRERVLANRSASERSDVVDGVLDEHAAHFDAPDDEDPVIVDARDTREEARIRAVVEAIRAVR